MSNLKSKINSCPFFLFLLPVFFVLHTVTENYGVPLLRPAVLLLTAYLAFCIVLSLLFWLPYKTFRKANLLAFYLVAFYLFFGSLHDFLKKYFSGTFIVRYTVIMPLALLALIILFLYLRKTNRKFIRLTEFLNWTLLVLILFDGSTLALKLIAQKPVGVNLNKQFKTCDNCATPDIYLIIADEYAGKKELKDLFGFDNSPFENELTKRQFHVIQNSFANYNATVYSMSSLFNMDYLSFLQSKFVNEREMFICREIINRNNAISFFKKEGYTIYNFSFFKTDDQEPIAELPYFISKARLFTSQTLTGRLNRDLGSNFATSKRIEEIKKQDLYNNDRVNALVRNIVSKNQSGPKFIYSHFYMPHHPYSFDSTGREIPFNKLSPDNDKKAYIQYLVYTNKKLLSLIDFIKTTSSHPPIIILMSDHGFRQLPEKIRQRYDFLNLNAVYLPNNDYSMFYDGMSNVNQFRVLLNSQFGQKLPLLPDSTTFLKE